MQLLKNSLFLSVGNHRGEKERSKKRQINRAKIKGRKRPSKAKNDYKGKNKLKKINHIKSYN